MVFERFKKGLYAGLGVVVMTGEEVRQAVERFAQAGKMSAEDGEALIRELTQKGEQQQEDFRQWAEEMIHSSLAALDLASKREHEELAAKVKSLEDRLALLEDLQLKEQGSP